MKPRLMGLESELALVAVDRSGAPVDRAEFSAAVMGSVEQLEPNLRGVRGRRLFLGNGAVMYIDAGDHIELCSPECATPTDVVHSMLANESILARHTAAIAIQEHLGSAFLTKCNIDYAPGSHATWGQHENYAYTCEPFKLPNELIPLLVARVVITGAGGFDATSDYACRFTLSPRSIYISRPIGSDSTGNRSIFHTKNEPLAAGFNRLHVICGEALCSQQALWLKLAMTNLVLGLIEDGHCPGAFAQLSNPVRALRAFADDPTLRARAPTLDGKSLTALEILDHYLGMVSRHADGPHMPEWAPQAIQAWGEMLERLRSGACAVERTLDWAIKRRLFSRIIDSHGFSWDTLSGWSSMAGLLATCHSLANDTHEFVLADVLRSRRGPMGRLLKEISPRLRASGVDPDRLDEYLALRAKLFELDTRFGRLGEASVFGALEAAGLLEHHVPMERDRVDFGRQAPRYGRAKVRGDFINRVWGSNERQLYLLDWEGAVKQGDDLPGLDLSDPHASTEGPWIPHLGERWLSEGAMVIVN